VTPIYPEATGTKVMENWTAVASGHGGLGRFLSRLSALAALTKSPITVLWLLSSPSELY